MLSLAATFNRAREGCLERLRHIREQVGYSQQDLADASGVSQHTISEIELGRRKPQGRTLRKLAKALGVEVSHFYGEPTYPKEEAPPNLQPSFNGLLEEERREAAYEPWLQFVNRYAGRWEARIAAGDLDLGSINEFARMLDDLLPTLAELEKRERLEVPTPAWETLKMNQVIGRLMSLFNPLLAAAASKFESSELEQVRRKRAELDKQIAEAG
jgi:transcriptional regulator with XRE-family HTH domain